MQDRGLAAYIAELVGTLFLVFFITAIGVLFVSVGDQAQFGSDYAVIGLTYGFVLTVLIVGIGLASGGHFNPAVTLGAMVTKKIAAVDGIIYMLAQLSGGVLGALLTKSLLLDEGRAANYGAATVSPLLAGNFAGMVVEALGTFSLVLVILAVGMGAKAIKDWAPLAIGLTFGFIGMVFGPLTGASVNPARWFGPALVSGEWGGVWPYLVGPIVGSLLAVAFFKFVIVKAETDAGGTPIEPPTPASSPATKATKAADKA